MIDWEFAIRPEFTWTKLKLCAMHLWLWHLKDFCTLLNWQRKYSPLKLWIFNSINRHFQACTMCHDNILNCTYTIYAQEWWNCSFKYSLAKCSESHYTYLIPINLYTATSCVSVARTRSGKMGLTSERVSGTSVCFFLSLNLLILCFALFHDVWKQAFKF